MVGFRYNNGGMSDLNVRMSDFRTEMKETLRLHEAKQDANFRRVEEMLPRKFVEVETQLARIEAQLTRAS